MNAGIDGLMDGWIGGKPTLLLRTVNGAATALTMQLEIPLTPALSPSDGARVKPTAAAHSPDGALSENAEGFPLPIGWERGEGLLQLYRYGYRRTRNRCSGRHGR